MSGQVVDAPSAAEFMAEVLNRISATELTQISGLLAGKSETMAAALTSPSPGEAAVRTVLGTVFSTRRRADRIIDAVGADRLGAAMVELVHGDAPVPERFNAFDEVCAPAADLTGDLPGELLHFCRPADYWLWTRWILDPDIGTGALPLITTDDVDLDGADRGETYLLVGRATAFVTENAHAAGFTDARSGPFGVDVFFAAVYGVYMYTVLRMRMTQEFTRLVPELPALIRRLLGVNTREA